MDRQLIISDSAQRQIENAIDYIAFTLNNLTAAESVLNDIEETYSEIIGYRT